jgi:predicted phosphodiesterase
MRFAAIADIHGNYPALEAVLADIKAQGIEDIVNLGDCFSGPLEADMTADRLLSLAIPTVRGNHDRYLVEQKPEEMHASDAAAYSQLGGAHLDWLRSLPANLVYNDEAYLCHATPRDDNLYWLDMAAADGSVVLRQQAEIEALASGIDMPLILCGHTHLPRMVELSGGRLIVNPGSVGCPAYNDEKPYPHKVETGHTMASYAVLEKTVGGWVTQFRNVRYDHMAMSRLAKANGRPDWAAALAAGRMPLSSLLRRVTLSSETPPFAAFLLPPYPLKCHDCAVMKVTDSTAAAQKDQEKGPDKENVGAFFLILGRLLSCAAEDILPLLGVDRRSRPGGPRFPRPGPHPPHRAIVSDQPVCPILLLRPPMKHVPAGTDQGSLA